MSDTGGRVVKRLALSCFLLSAVCFARGQKIESGARREIDAGNQAWINGMKEGRAAVIGATYTDDAVDCSSGGICIHGRVAIEQHMKEQLEKLGKARAAFVTSIGSVQQGDFVYEWGQAKAKLLNGKIILDRYLTAWRKQRDGSWKIFRNLVIPQNETR